MLRRNAAYRSAAIAAKQALEAQARSHARPMQGRLPLANCEHQQFGEASQRGALVPQGPPAELAISSLLQETEFPFNLRTVAQSSDAVKALSGVVTVSKSNTGGPPKFGALEWLRFPLYDRLAALLRPMLPAHRKAFFVWAALNAQSIEQLPNPFVPGPALQPASAASSGPPASGSQRRVAAQASSGAAASGGQPSR